MEIIRYLGAGIGIGFLLCGLWAIYCIDQFKKKEKKGGK